MTREEITKIVTEQKQRDNLIRENAAKFAEEFENSSSTINKKLALFDGFKFGAYWADEHLKEGLVSIDKVCAYLEMRIDDYIIRDLRKAMEL